MPGTARQAHGAHADVLGSSLEGISNARGHRRRRDQRGWIDGDRQTARAGMGDRKRPRFSLQRVEQPFLHIAKLKHEGSHRRHHIGGARLKINVANVPDSVRAARNQQPIENIDRKSQCGGACVLTQLERRRARMIGATLDNNAEAPDADNRRHDADWKATFNNEAGVKAVEAYRNDIAEHGPTGAESFCFDEAANVFGQGKAYSFVTFVRRAG